MNLLVFDLDGTLADTNAIDGQCYVDACREVLGIELDGVDWSTFEHVTDAGIAEALRPGCSAELQANVVARLERAASEHPEDFREIAGTSELLRSLPTTQWRAVIATGAWLASARIKLRAANLPQDLPIASSDDAQSREAIVLHAIELAKQHYAVQAFERIVLVGDADWDERTAANLGLPFIRVHGTIPF
jgi:phosphoglycolate phosphatase-like HAD superfamily hydrolase